MANPNYQSGGALLPNAPARLTSTDPWNFDVAPTVGTDVGQGAQTITTNSNTQTLTNKTIASSSTVPYVQDATGAGSKKIVMGTVALVTGAVTVASGLTTVTTAVASPGAQPTGTGAASMQILVPTWTTGAVTFTAYSVSSVTGATAAANTSTGTINYWIAGS